MSNLLRISVVFSLVAVLIVAGTVMIGRQAQAGVDPCATVAPTLAPATNTPGTGVTETVDPGTITPAVTDTVPAVTDTVPAPTDTATDVPPTNTDTPIPTDTPQQQPDPTNTPVGIPTNTPITAPDNVAGFVNNSGNVRVLYQAVDCETPAPEATTDPVTELPNTGSGTESGSNTWMLALILMIAASAVAIRMRFIVRR